MIDPTSFAANLQLALADRYRIRSELGRGGMAVVFAADDLRHARRVALKVLNAEASSLVGTERFAREVRVSAGLSHPHIVPVFDSGEAAGHLYFVMPLIEGETLRVRLAREGRLAVADATQIARELADALEFAHRAGVIHRDVKPENVLLSHGHTLLADFGIARTTDGAQAGLTGTGMFVGTPEYMSPEQVLGESQVAASSDVYSLGCVLFEMLAGAPPFRGPTPQATLARRVTGPVPHVREARPEVPEALEVVLRSALATDPSARCASCAAFGEALNAAVRHETVATLPDVSLVVRPFDAVGGDAGLSDFADGLTEEVIGDLSKIRRMRVISRTSAMRLKGTDKAVRAIGNEYAVRYVVTGSVRQAGSKVRVATEIADSILDASIWSERFDGAIDDPFALQESVARAIASALNITLTPADDRRLATRLVPDPRAADCARRAATAIISFTKDGLDHGEALARQGLAILGDNAQLFAAMAMAEFQRVNGGYEITDAARIQQHMAMAHEWLDRALALDPTLPDAHFTRAWMLQSTGDPGGALRHCRLALGQDPNHELALAQSAVMGWVLGRHAELQATLARLLAIDPFNAWGRLFHATELAFAGDRAGRDREFVRLFAIAPAPLFYQIAGLVFAQDDELSRASEAWAYGENGDENDFGTVGCKAGRAALAGDPAPARRFVNGLRDNAVFAQDPKWAWHGASIAALAGLEDEAMQMIERAVVLGFANLPMLEGRDATLRPLHRHSRYPGLLTTARAKAAEIEHRLAEA